MLINKIKARKKSIIVHHTGVLKEINLQREDQKRKFLSM